MYPPSVGSPTSVRAQLEQRLAVLPGLARRKSRHGDGYSFFVADREVAHFHGDQRMDVRLTKERIREMKSERSLDPRVATRGPHAEWVAVSVSRAEDLALAVHLVEEAIRANA